MAGLYWEEFAAGGSWQTGERRLVAGDLAAYAELSGDGNPLHLDDGHARASGFEGRIAQGVLGLAVATGLLNRLGLTAGTLVALLGTRWRFERPLYPGTTVRVDLSLRSKRRTSRSDRGVVVLSGELRDAEGMVYQRGNLTLLVRRRPDA